jgi:hypothetical protein
MLRHLQNTGTDSSSSSQEPTSVFHPNFIMHLNGVVKLRITCLDLHKNIHFFYASLPDCSLFCLLHKFFSERFVKGAFSIDPKKNPMILYTLPRLTLICLSCFKRSLVYCQCAYMTAKAAFHRTPSASCDCVLRDAHK